MSKKRKTKIYAFLDSNILLQFLDYDQIDWPTVLGCTQVCLVLAPVVLSEIDGFKYDQKSPRRQSRSRHVLHKIHQLIVAEDVGAEVAVPQRAGVTLLVLTDSPDMSLYIGLEPNVNDDLLIASILQYTATFPASDPHNIMLVGDDVGCLHKARAQHISTYRLDDHLRLQDEPSPEQKELQKLRKELAALQIRQPSIRLDFLVNDVQTEELTVSISLLHTPNPVITEQLLRQERQATQLDELNNVAGLSLVLSREIIDQYKADCINYLDRFRAYLADLYDWDQRYVRSSELTLSIMNDGTAPAQNVRITLFIPHNLQVSAFFPRIPPPPERPRWPQLDLSFSYDAIVASALLPYYGSDAMEADIGTSVEAPRITSINNRLCVIWQLDKVVHHVPQELTPVIVELPGVRSASTYELAYTLIADNIPTPITGMLRLHVTAREQPFDMEKALEVAKEEHQRDEEEG
ncbi:MAG: hypothetical protein HC828_04205 [Blastochloris sp.]|nr:hypothetical protein [Blastochloris sp.]